MSAITITKALPDHMGAVLALESECYHDPFTKEKLLKFLEDTSAVFLCALDEKGAPIGHVIGCISADECEVYTVAVSKVERNHGIGYELVKSLILSAYEARVKTIFLEVRRSNYVAAALYEKAGFLHTGMRRAYYKNPVEDALLYALNL